LLVVATINTQFLSGYNNIALYVFYAGHYVVAHGIFFDFCYLDAFMSL